VSAIYYIALAFQHRISCILIYMTSFLSVIPGGPANISPLQLSRSAIEYLFSQYKFTAGGKLDSVNYTIIKAACLIKQYPASHYSGKNAGTS